MAKKKIPAFKVGSWKDQSGKVINVDNTFLEDIVSATKSFQYQDDQFPLVLGHPKHNDPAYGWVNKNDVVVEDGVLVAFADDEKVTPELKDLYEKNYYKAVSVQLRPDRSIRHIGFLGAKPPAVTGLPAIQFAEDEIKEDLIFNFSEYELSSWWARSIGGVFRSLKNFLIEKYDLETADKIMPDYAIDDINAGPRIFEKVNNELSQSYSEEEMKTVQELERQNTTLTDQVQSLTNEIASLKTDKTNLNAQLTTVQKEQRRKEITSFCESDLIANKIKPAEKETVIDLLLAVSDLQNLSFGEGDEKKEIMPVDLVKNLLLGQKDLVSFGEHATHENADNNDGVDVSEFAEKNVDAERLELHKKVLTLVKKENLSYADALKRVN